MSKKFAKYICILLVIFPGSYYSNSIPFQSIEESKESAFPESKKSDSTNFNYNSRINALKKELNTSFIIKGHSYFVIASNLSKTETDKIITNIIDKALECFYNDYFEQKPDELTTILLFKDDESYRFWARELFDDTNISKFGYYKPLERTMLMNINTGTGTLVHELTHALVRFDFPEIPAWFNEGLGSLYERSSLNNRNIIGYVNWRLPALQNAIINYNYISIENLMKTDWDGFYKHRSEFNYAQARYLCMYMQELGFLKKYYKHFRDTFEEDTTGIKQMEDVFGKSINKIDEMFIDWVKTLKYE